MYAILIGKETTEEKQKELYELFKRFDLPVKTEINEKGNRVDFLLTQEELYKIGKKSFGMFKLFSEKVKEIDPNSEAYYIPTGIYELLNIMYLYENTQLDSEKLSLYNENKIDANSYFKINEYIINVCKEYYDQENIYINPEQNKKIIVEITNKLEKIEFNGEFNYIKIRIDAIIEFSKKNILEDLLKAEISSEQNNSLFIWRLTNGITKSEELIQDMVLKGVAYKSLPFKQQRSRNLEDFITTKKQEIQNDQDLKKNLLREYFGISKLKMIQKESWNEKEEISILRKIHNLNLSNTCDVIDSPYQGDDETYCQTKALSFSRTPFSAIWFDSYNRKKSACSLQYYLEAHFKFSYGLSLNIHWLSNLGKYLFNLGDNSNYAQFGSQEIFHPRLKKIEFCNTNKKIYSNFPVVVKNVNTPRSSLDSNNKLEEYTYFCAYFLGFMKNNIVCLSDNKIETLEVIQKGLLLEQKFLVSKADSERIGRQFDSLPNSARDDLDLCSGGIKRWNKNQPMLSLFNLVDTNSRPKYAQDDLQVGILESNKIKTVVSSLF